MFVCASQSARNVAILSRTRKLLAASDTTAVAYGKLGAQSTVTLRGALRIGTLS